MTGGYDDPVPTVEQTMREIREIFRQIEATQDVIIERVIELAKLRGVDISSGTGRTLG